MDIQSTSVFVLRGQPFHKAHHKIIRTALETTDKVLIVVGSYRSPITIRNPFNFEQREQIIRGSLTPEENNRVMIDHVRDFFYSYPTWVTSLQSVVANITVPEDRISLIAHYKDSGSEWVNWFPTWEKNIIQCIKFNGARIDATGIRSSLFEGKEDWKKYVSDFTVDYLEKYSKTDEFARLQREYDFIVKYKKSWESAPYPPTFVTTDAVVVQAGHVLLVVRKTEPGKGYFALPGGFLNPKESIKQGTIRELKEETGIRVPTIILEKCIKETKTFDNPLRDLRGRTVTHASLIELDYNDPLPHVKGADDAEKAVWMPFNELALHEEKFYGDHLHIINFFMSGKLYNR